MHRIRKSKTSIWLPMPWSITNTAVPFRGWKLRRQHPLRRHILDHVCVDGNFKCVCDPPLICTLAPLDLVAELFTTAACSFRAESYWTYEVCHGDYIKQYHEEREGKSVKLQEYVLGRWDKKHTEQLQERLAAAEQRNEPVQYKKIESLTLPYLEVEMANGTPCGLIDNKPRSARVLYVCYPHGKNEVYSLKEVSTCQYEVVILTQSLCDHPSYKPLAASEHRIRCSPSTVGAPLPPMYMWSTEMRIVSVLCVIWDGHNLLILMYLRLDLESSKAGFSENGSGHQPVQAYSG